MDIGTLITAAYITFGSLAVPQYVYIGGQYRACLPYDYECRTVPPQGLTALPSPPPYPSVYAPPHPIYRVEPVRPAPRAAPPQIQEHPLTMEQDRERVIEQGEAHCRRWPQDKICHPMPK